MQRSLSAAQTCSTVSGPCEVFDVRFLAPAPGGWAASRHPSDRPRWPERQHRSIRASVRADAGTHPRHSRAAGPHSLIFVATRVRASGQTSPAGARRGSWPCHCACGLGFAREGECCGVLVGLGHVRIGFNMISSPSREKRPAFLPALGVFALGLCGPLVPAHWSPDRSWPVSPLSRYGAKVGPALPCDTGDTVIRPVLMNNMQRARLTVTTRYIFSRTKQLCDFSLKFD